MFDLLAFIFLSFLAAISPGPDFAIVVHYGLTGSRKAALLTAAGVALALLFHVSYCMSGVAFLLQKNPSIMKILRVLGSLYLGYIGIKILSSQKNIDKDEEPRRTFFRHPFVAGFSTNLLNPKSTFFCISLLVQFAYAYTTVPMKVAYGLSIPLTAITWYSFISYCFTHPRFIPFVKKQKALFTKAMGYLLVILSISSFIFINI
ncbi:MAG: hypothetical protein COT84_01590 [Chlamydiae bacterium CG10_big_fil_rev_8_21_14_0_10_35_9]|nr:MAG: hypothetical protein COT84_01590 [Chlamydiae bacterium CG10_big_fil_rev_8_21_14_0_10_35_9]